MGCFHETFSTIFSFFQVSGYTLEAGVRELERKIGSLCRAVAVQIAEDNKIMDETTKNSAVSFWTQKKIRKKKDCSNIHDFLQITNMKIKLEDRDKAAISSNPPKMPKVLDVSAVQEILGVSTYQVISILPITFYNLIWREKSYQIG